MNIIIGIVCFLLGFFIIFPYRIKLIKYNKETEELNNQLEEDNKKLKEEKTEHRAELAEILNRQAAAQDSVDSAIAKYKETKLSEAQLQVDKEKEKYETAKEEYSNDYLNTLDEYVKNFKESNATLQQETKKLQEQFSELRAKVDAAVEARKRENDVSNHLIIPTEDQREIDKLKEIIPSFKDPTALRKVIWKVYYENPTTALIGRIVGKGTVCGIYKITNIKNGMTYVGQSTDIAERWRQHIKRGIGADPPTKNKLYPAMLEEGVENFTFEIIEKCSKENLNEREKFWQDYFHSQDYGYSIR